MRACTVLLLTSLVSILAAGCTRPAPTREYELQGQILAIQAERNEVLIKHGDIKGFMPGMTMPFKVKEGTLLSGKQPGDLVTATLVVGEVDAHLSTLTTTGHAALEAPPAVSDAPRVLVPGDEVADALLIDQDGKPLPFSSLRGRRVALTFVYTRCPLAEFCPLMDRHFAAVQKTVSATPSLSDVRLLTMTFDPEFDTPAVLQAHARRQNANPAVWTFATGDPKEIARFAGQFGVYVEQSSPGSPDITHNLVTVVINRDGRLVKRHTGTDWTPAELVADLAAAAAPAN
jgi:protein SCO1/2